MSNKRKNLLYITFEYPNVRGDSAFIYTELKYLSKFFDQIIVLSHGNPETESVCIPDNVCVNYFKNYTRVFRYFLFFKSLFSKVFWKEFLLILSNKKKLHCMKQALIFLGRAELEKAQISKLVDKFDINILYTFWYVHSTLACQLVLKEGKNKNKYLCTRAHRFDLYELLVANNYQPYKLQMDKYIDKIFFISRDGLNYYKNIFASSENSKYKLNYLGTDNYNVFLPHDYKNEIRLLSVSHVVPVKRIKFIIDILSICEKKSINVKWAHIGIGNEYDDILSYARNKLKDAKFIDYNFLGFKTNEEVHNYYKENTVDLFISTSESEGLPVSMMEAMSYGIPVIATDVGGVNEIVDASCGFLVKMENCVDESFNAIEKWHKMTTVEKQGKSLCAYEKWDSNFNAKKNYTKFAQELLELINLY